MPRKTKVRKAKKYTADMIRHSLYAQLDGKKAGVPHFQKLVEDYCWMAEQVDAMKADIHRRGMVYTTTVGNGKEAEKENPAVRYIPQYERQMLAILRELGLTVDTVDDEGPDDL